MRIFSRTPSPQPLSRGGKGDDRKTRAQSPGGFSNCRPAMGAVGLLGHFWEWDMPYFMVVGVGFVLALILFFGVL